MGMKTIYFTSIFVKFGARGAKNLHEHLRGVVSTDGAMGADFPFEPPCTIAID
jgi:hypothetical protein